MQRLCGHRIPLQCRFQFFALKFFHCFQLEFFLLQSSNLSVCFNEYWVTTSSYSIELLSVLLLRIVKLFKAIPQNHSIAKRTQKTFKFLQNLKINSFFLLENRSFEVFCLAFPFLLCALIHCVLQVNFEVILLLT